jgi:hypothetical protein
MHRLFLICTAATLFAVAATLDKMTAAGKSDREIANVSTRTAARVATRSARMANLDSTRRAAGLARVPKVASLGHERDCPGVGDKRTPAQREKAVRFEEFGRNFCHRITPGKLGLTEVGANLSHLHLGSVDVERLVSSPPPAKR